MRKQVICFSEAGWRGMRRFNLLLNRLGIPSFICVNVRPPENVRRLIESKPLILNYFLPRKLSRPLSYLIFILRAVTGQVSGIVVEKNRTLSALAFVYRPFKIPVLFLEEIDNGFRLFKDGTEISNPDTVLESLLA
ncbi:MAG: hypothetical protein HY587_06270 [Candidatus Omnitrophica bacterium]|nr:hypothetical protein [Candidatus Omnitrophota bacterium]